MDKLTIKMRFQTILSIAAMFLPVVGSSSQQVPVTAPQTAQPTDAPTYTLRSTVREVTLDVVVTDSKGNPVHGLTRNDFKLLDEGNPQTLRSFAEHNGSAAPAQPAFKLPPNTFTNYAPVGNVNASFIILFDSLDSAVEDQQKAYVAANDFLKDLAPGTNVAIFDLHERMNLVQGFTTDRTLLLNALKDKRVEPRSSPLLGTGNEQWRQQILNEGMMMLGRYLSGFPGRKNLIWFVVNIPGSLNSRTASIQAGAPVGSPPGAEVAVDSALTAASPLAAQTIVGQPVGGDQQGQSTVGSQGTGQGLQQTPSGIQQTAGDLNGNVRPGGNPGQNQFVALTNLIDDSKSTSDVLTLSKVVVYPVDPRQLMVSIGLSERFEQAAMQDVAEATGGEAFVNRNGIKSIMQEIVTKGSDFYTLTYSPTNLKWDGSFRRLKVETAGGGTQSSQTANLHLAYRPGYYAADRVLNKDAMASGLAGSAGTSNGQFVLASEVASNLGEVGLPGSLPKGGLQASMMIGQIPPTELILNASVKPSTSALKLAKDGVMPEGDFMRDKFKHQPYRMYDVLFATDAHGFQLPQSPDGLHHGGVEFVAAVYTEDGDVVNSFKVTIALNLKDESYRLLLRNGMGTKRSLAIPVKGSYVVRLGVHDMNSDRVGALEFPLTAVSQGVAGVGQQGAP